MKPETRIISPSGRKLFKPTLEPNTMSGRILEQLKSGPKTYKELLDHEQRFKGDDTLILPRFSYILSRMVLYNQIIRIKRGLYSLNTLQSCI